MTKEEELRQRLELLDKLEASDAPIGPGPMDKLGDAALRALDLTSGPLRVGLGTKAMGMAGKFKPQQLKEDLLNMIQGKAPTMDVYRQRLGIPKGPALSRAVPGVKDTMLDVTPGGVGAGLLDMVLSPSHLPGLGILGKLAAEGPQTATALRAAQKAARESALLRAAESTPMKAARGAGEALGSVAMGNPVSSAMENVGSKIYKSALIKPDIVAAEANKLPVSQLLMDAGITGGPEQLLSRAELLKRKIGEMIGQTEAMPGVPPAKAAKFRINKNEATSPASELATTMASSDVPEFSQAGKNALDEITQYVEKPNKRARPPWEQTLPEAIRFKRENAALADKMGQYAQDPNLSLKGEIKAKLGMGTAREIEDALDALKPGLGGQYYGLNQKYGALRTAEPELQKMADKSMTKSLLPTWGDLPLGGTSLMLAHQAGMSPWMGLATSYGASKLLQSPAAKTRLGLTAAKLGQLGIADPLIRKSLMQYYGNTGEQP